MYIYVYILICIDSPGHFKHWLFQHERLQFWASTLGGMVTPIMNVYNVIYQCKPV